MVDSIERAAFICSRDTIDGAYPALILGSTPPAWAWKPRFFTLSWE